MCAHAQDVKTQRLGEAFRGQNVLLVCDDVWDPEHERRINFVDNATGSKVLVSSRIHATLAAGGADSSTDDSAWIVQIQLPTEDQAVSMLLSTAGVRAELDHVEISPISKGLRKQFFNTQSLFVNPAVYGQDFLEYLRIMAHAVRTHPDPRMQKMSMILLAVSGMNHPSFEADGWDWDEIYLSSDGKTSFSKQVAEFYDFSSCHRYCIKECYGADWSICGSLIPSIMAFHYGELHESIQHYERMMLLVDEVLVQPNQAEEAVTILMTGMLWPHFALDMKRPEVFLRAMEKLQFTWAKIDATIAQHHLHYAMPGSAAWVSLLIKSSYVMCGGDMHGVSVDEIVAILPTWEEHIEIAKSGYVD
jgi:hypothetical protein